MDEPSFDMEACIALVRQGDQLASHDLVRRLYPLVLKLVRAHLPRRTSEEDLCQMVFIKIFANIGQYSGNVPIGHWVSRIAVNTCFNQLKAEKIRPELRWADLSEDEAGVLQALNETSGDLHPAESMASREVVGMLLAELNVQDRLVINLLYLDGCSMQEVRQITGWNIALVKVRAFRARQRLKSAFNKLMMEGRL